MIRNPFYSNNLQKYNLKPPTMCLYHLYHCLDYLLQPQQLIFSSCSRQIELNSNGALCNLSDY